MDETPAGTPARRFRSTVATLLIRVGLGGLVSRISRARATARENRRLARWSRDLQKALDAPSRLQLLAGTVASDSIPVIVCLWSRPDRLADVLSQVSAQRDVGSVRLVVWNNRSENSPRYEAEIAAWGARGAINSIEFVNAPANLGGIARFVAARHLLEDGFSGHFITLDDDQQISTSFVSDLLAARVPDGIAGWWAFRSTEDYWDRVAVEPGEAATYVGTGGAIFDSSIVANRRFFTELPAKYGFLEDIWASDWVLRHGGVVTKAETDIHFVQEELNQHHALVGLKAEFVRYLAERSS